MASKDPTDKSMLREAYSSPDLKENDSMSLKAARRIKDLPPEERPREKLLLKGPQALSDAELLAILIGSGAPQKSALALGEELLHHYQSFRGMAGRSLEEFMAVKGLKEAKVLNIAAAFEIARRIVEQVLTQQPLQTEEE